MRYIKNLWMGNVLKEGQIFKCEICGKKAGTDERIGKGTQDP